MNDTNYQCLDIDECQTGQHSCNGTNGVCLNSVGAYHCACLSGYLDKLGDGSECTDIDECYHGQVCGYKSKCVNNPGSYSCPCDQVWFFTCLFS